MSTKVLKINFSSRTSAQDLYKNVAENVEKKSGKIYGPPGGKRMLVFIDDLNMPRVDMCVVPAATLARLRGHAVARGASGPAPTAALARALASSR